MRDGRLFSLLVILASFVVVFVICVGGVVCIREDAYSFHEYLLDISIVAPYLFGAIAAVLLRSLVRERNGRNGKT